MAGAVLAFARAYARHGGIDAREDVLREAIVRRMAPLPAGLRLSLGLVALAVRWAAPLVLCGRPVRFDSLTPERRERLLERLHRSRAIVVHGAFMGLAAIVVPACHGVRGDG